MYPTATPTRTIWAPHDHFACCQLPGQGTTRSRHSPAYDPIDELHDQKHAKVRPAVSCSAREWGFRNASPQHQSAGRQFSSPVMAALITSMTIAAQIMIGVGPQK